MVLALGLSWGCSQDSAGLQSSEDLNEVGGSCSGTAYSHGCWQKVSVPCHVDLSIGLSECSYNMAADFPQSQGSEREQKGSPNACYDLVAGVSCCHFCYICSLKENHSVQPTLKGRGIKLQFMKGGVLKNLWIKYIESTELLKPLEFPKWWEQRKVKRVSFVIYKKPHWTTPDFILILMWCFFESH